MVFYMAYGGICQIGHHVTYYGMAAIKDYLHLRIVGAYHLPVFSSIAHFFHPEVITRIGNSFKMLNKFRIAIF